MEPESLSAAVTPKILDCGLESDTTLCKICSKVFSNKLSRNRHQLYCKKKHFSGQPNIRKSCTACRRAKVKCNSRSPSCGRCEEKDISCAYDRTARSSTTAPKSRGLLVDRTIDNKSRAEEATALPSLGSEIPHADSSTASLDIPFELDHSLSWDLDNSLTSCYTPQDSGYDGSSTVPSFSPSNPQFDILLFDSELPSEDFEFTLQPDIADYLLYEASDPGCMFEGPYLVLKYIAGYHGPVSRMSTVARRQSPFTLIAKQGSAMIGLHFILQNIKAYPALLLNELEPPPFIHKACLMSDNERNAGLGISPRSDHLAICRNIVQMYQTKTPQTQAFISRTISAEVQRFVEEYNTTNNWETLSMLQATAIYILLRISDAESSTIDSDNTLIETMTLIAIKLEQSGFLCTGEVHGYRPSWHEWILVESKRRTITVLFFICLLFEISPHQNGKALAGLMSLPLPTTKILWQTTTEEEWITLYDNMLFIRQGRRYLSYADLVVLGRDINSEDERLEDLNRWFTSLDRFGILVMMAATTF